MPTSAPTETADWTGKPCPKCGYVRSAADANPAWQCPRCQIAYAKYDPSAAAALHEKLVAHGREMAARASSDHSLAALIAANLLALAIAYGTKMSARDLMLVYWIQSVIIGVANVIRILKLHSFDTAGFRMNDKPVMETTQSKFAVAGFFAMHYGFFHLIYFVFLTTPSHHKGAVHLSSPVLYVLLGLVFAVTHFFSLRHNLESDAVGRPNIGTLMMMPYLRVVPMHIAIIFGLGLLQGGPGAVVLFGVLKTVFDALMHVAQHHFYAKPAAG